MKWEKLDKLLSFLHNTFMLNDLIDWSTVFIISVFCFSTGESHCQTKYLPWNSEGEGQLRIIHHVRGTLELLQKLSGSQAGSTISAWCLTSSIPIWEESKVTYTSSPNVWSKRDTRWWSSPTPMAGGNVSGTWPMDWRSTTSPCRWCTTSPLPPPASTASHSCAVCLSGNASLWCMLTARSPLWPMMHCFMLRPWAWPRYVSHLSPALIWKLAFIHFFHNSPLKFIMNHRCSLTTHYLDLLIWAPCWPTSFSLCRCAIPTTLCACPTPARRTRCFVQHSTQRSSLLFPTLLTPQTSRLTPPSAQTTGSLLLWSAVLSIAKVWGSGWVMCWDIV